MSKNHTPGLPYAHLNLRRNPFSQPPPEARAALAVVDQLDLPRLAARLRQGRFVLQLMGQCGRGKSTHMRALHALLPEAPLVYFPEDPPRPPVPLGAPLMLLDETQRIGWWTRRKLWRSGAGIVAGTHQDHTAELRRAGVAFEAHTIEGLTPDRLRAIVARRIEWARRDDGPVPWLTDEAIDGLIATHGDDLRAIERLGYELFQRMRTIGPMPWPPPQDVPTIAPSQHLHDGGVREIITRRAAPLPTDEHTS